MLTVRAALAAAMMLAAVSAHAQMPPPHPAGADPAQPPGFITRTAVNVGLAHLASGDDRFDYAARFTGDIDIADFGWGRASFVGAYEAVFGTERRVFDLNHENYAADVSLSYRTRGHELARAA